LIDLGIFLIVVKSAPLMIYKSGAQKTL
jgi:hypothetical protein